MFNKKNALLVALAAFSVSSQAAVPLAATDALSTIQTDGLAMIDNGWPIVAALTAGFVLIKLFKKIVSRAS